MADLRDPHGDTVGAQDDIEQLRNRIRELEDQLRRSDRTGTRDPTRESDAADRLKVLAAASAITIVFLAPPAFITLRRWVRWWR